MLHRITVSIEIFCYFSYGSIFTGISLQEIIIVQFRCPWVCCDVGPIYFFFDTWCFLCCCSPRLGKYYSSNLQSLSSSATFGFFRFKILMSFFTDNTECTCRLKLGCFSTFQLLIFCFQSACSVCFLMQTLGWVQYVLYFYLLLTCLHLNFS